MARVVADPSCAACCHMSGHQAGRRHCRGPPAVRTDRPQHYGCTSAGVGALWKSVRMEQVLREVRESAEAALRRWDWKQVVESLGSVDPAELTAEELFTLFTARVAVGQVNESAADLELSYARYVDDGDNVGAAWTSLFLAFLAGARGDFALSSGWGTTAGRHFEGLAECKAHVLAGVVLSYRGMTAGHYDGVVDSMVAARETARRLGELDLEMWALQREGKARAKRGEVQAGLALTDEAMVAALGARLNPIVMQQIFCETISLCQELGDVKRAAQWIAAGDRFTSARGVEWSGDCRIHRAGVMKQCGSLPRAEAEARLGCQEFAESGWEHNLHYGWGWSEIGEIRLRVGDLDGAGEALTMAHEKGYPPSRGLALLWMARGDQALAAREIDRALEQQVVNRLSRVNLLDAAVHIRLALGDVAGAERAYEEVSEIAEVYGSDAFNAAERCAHGAISAAYGDHEKAMTSLRAGIARWSEVGSPYEAALSRVRLAEILIETADPHSARLELQAARLTFLELGAEPDVQRVSALLAEIDDDTPDLSVGQRVEKTFMFTDIQQSTALASAMGEDQWDRILRSHDRLLRDAIREVDGRVVKHEGDGLFAVFDTRPSAVGAAVLIQQRLAAHRDAHGFAPAVRIGLHSGSATERNGDYFGMAVNTAARVMSLADGGEIVATDIFADVSGARVSEARSVELKGLSEPTHVVDVLWQSVSDQAPEIASL